MTAAAAMIRQELLALPAAVTPETAFRAVGCGRTAGYELIRSGSWPTRVIRLGRLIRIPTAELLELLGVDPATGGPDDDDNGAGCPPALASAPAHRELREGGARRGGRAAEAGR